MSPVAYDLSQHLNQIEREDSLNEAWLCLKDEHLETLMLRQAVVAADCIGRRYAAIDWDDVCDRAEDLGISRKRAAESLLDDYREELEEAASAGRQEDIELARVGL